MPTLDNISYVKNFINNTTLCRDRAEFSEMCVALLMKAHVNARVTENQRVNVRKRDETFVLIWENSFRSVYILHTHIACVYNTYIKHTKKKNINYVGYGNGMYEVDENGAKTKGPRLTSNHFRKFTEPKENNKKLI